MRGTVLQGSNGRALTGRRWVGGRRVSIVLVEGALAVDARSWCYVTGTVLKARVVVGGDVPIAAHSVVDVLTQVLGILTLPQTGAEAELRIGHKAHPLVNLFVLLAKGIRENQSTDWVSISICSMRVELASHVSFGNIYLRQVTCARHLDIRRSFDEMGSLNSALWNQSCAIAAFHTP